MASDIHVASVLGPHGLKGEVRVKFFTENAERLKAYGTLHTLVGRKLSVSALRSAKPDEAIIAFAGVSDRTGAEELKGAGLFVRRESLPALDESEFYHADLIGLSAHDREDRRLGTVRAVHNFGAGDVIEIDRPDGDTVMLAFTRENVPSIDLAAGRIVVAVPEETEAGPRGNVE